MPEQSDTKNGEGETGSRESATEGGGEDDASTEENGDDSHLHDD